MADYRLSEASKLDLADIYEYGIEHFGIFKAQKYLQGIDDIFSQLVVNPKLGRSVNELYPGLRRFVYRAHVVLKWPIMMAKSSLKSQFPVIYTRSG